MKSRWRRVQTPYLASLMLAAASVSPTRFVSRRFVATAFVVAFGGVVVVCSPAVAVERGLAVGVLADGTGDGSATGRDAAARRSHVHLRHAAPADSLFLRRVQALLDSVAHPWLRWPQLGDVATDLRRAYEATGGAPLWLNGRVPTPPALALIAELRAAELRGLDRDDFDADSIAARVPRVRFAEGAGFDSLAAEWDVALSVAATRYALALQRGRVNPRKLYGFLRFSRDTTDGANHLLALRSTGQPRAYLDQLEPPFAQYRQLKAALPRLLLLERDSTLPELPTTQRRFKLKAGERWPGLPAVRQRLAAAGDYPVDSLVPLDTLTRFDSVTVRAVRRFQRRQGFADDGVIGDSTLARLRRPYAEQVRQVALTMERWRWLPKIFGTPPILVNLAEFRLYGFRGQSDAADSVLTMNVVVGTSVDKATPLLADTMTSVVFRPYWDVPKSIMVEEIRPKALKDSTWFIKENYELVEKGTVLPPTKANLARIAQGAVRVRQKPGAGNALGEMKFLLPNEEDIYLHDTPSRSLFKRARRDFSHGCVRVADPMALALHVLRDRPDWTRARIDSLLAKPTPTSVRLKTPVPVYLVYGTAVADTTGTLTLYADLYHHDATLDATLRQGFPY